MDIGEYFFHSCFISWKTRGAIFSLKSSSHIIKRNSLFRCSHDVLTMSERASLWIERSNGCTRDAIHIALNIMTLSNKLNNVFIGFGTVLCQEEEKRQGSLKAFRKSLRTTCLVSHTCICVVTLHLQEISLEKLCVISYYPASRKLNCQWDSDHQ